MTTLYVTYPGTAQTRFDRDYYIHTHLPLVREAWGPHGLETVAAFFPAGDGEGTVAVCVCGFRDDAAMRNAFASPLTGQVMADVPRFTDAKPLQSRALPIQS